MNEIYEYDCREAADDAIDRIVDVTANISAWALDLDEFEKRVEGVQREFKLLNIILAAWKHAEAKSKDIAALAPIMEETTQQKGDAQ